MARNKTRSQGQDKDQDRTRDQDQDTARRTEPRGHDQGRINCLCSKLQKGKLVLFFWLFGVGGMGP